MSGWNIGMDSGACHGVPALEFLTIGPRTFKSSNLSVMVCQKCKEHQESPHHLSSIVHSLLLPSLGPKLELQVSVLPLAWRLQVACSMGE